MRNKSYDYVHFTTKQMEGLLYEDKKPINKNKTLQNPKRINAIERSKCNP
ncbi:hypothetical protein [Flavobacterium franklandianum]|nr:hypothetical protein [Flavobacterium franklandianum]